jgi:hypothetical protein
MKMASLLPRFKKRDKGEWGGGTTRDRPLCFSLMVKEMLPPREERQG